MREKVVVTGLGMISCAGPDVATNWANIAAGVTGITHSANYMAENGAAIAGGFITEGYEACDHATARSTRFAAIAAREALADAGVTRASSADKWAISIGTSYGDSAADEDAVAPPASLDFLYHRLGIDGQYMVVSNACVSGSNAVIHALDSLRAGDTDIALAVGSEGLDTFKIVGHSSLRTLSPDGVLRPFHRNRNGTVLGEGAAALVLETVDHALHRGARIYGELAGAGMSNDCHDLVGPSADGQATAMRRALEDARLPPNAVQYICAHGTGTVQNDVSEALAISEVFAANLRDVRVSSIKPIIGHTLGACGVHNAVATVLAISASILPPNANLGPDECAFDLNLVVDPARETALDVALCNSFGFGGNNSVMIFSRHTSTFWDAGASRDLHGRP